jgi:hypothetical protein
VRMGGSEARPGAGAAFMNVTLSGMRGSTVVGALLKVRTLYSFDLS